MFIHGKGREIDLFSGTIQGNLPIYGYSCGAIFCYEDNYPARYIDQLEGKDYPALMSGVLYPTYAVVNECRGGYFSGFVAKDYFAPFGISTTLLARFSYTSFCYSGSCLNAELLYHYDGSCSGCWCGEVPLINGDMALRLAISGNLNSGIVNYRVYYGGCTSGTSGTPYTDVNTLCNYPPRLYTAGITVFDECCDMTSGAEYSSLEIDFLGYTRQVKLGRKIDNFSVDDLPVYAYDECCTEGRNQIAVCPDPAVPWWTRLPTDLNITITTSGSCSGSGTITYSILRGIVPAVFGGPYNTIFGWYGLVEMTGSSPTAYFWIWLFPDLYTPNSLNFYIGGDFAGISSCYLSSFSDIYQCDSEDPIYFTTGTFRTGSCCDGTEIDVEIILTE